MGIEIEHKFLVSGEGWRAAADKVTAMAQGYLSGPPSMEAGGAKASVRVRVQGEAAFLNIKSVQLGASRQEFEYPIPVDQARALLALCTGGIVDKRRHYVRHAGHLWEVDEFLGDNAGLVVAEIELQREDEPFEKPDWAGTDVTEQARYYNLVLASRPYSQWTPAEQRGEA